MIKTRFDKWQWKKVNDRPKTWELGMFDGEIYAKVFGRIIKINLEWHWFANVRFGPEITGKPERFRDSAMQLVEEQLEIFIARSGRKVRL